MKSYVLLSKLTSDTYIQIDTHNPLSTIPNNAVTLLESCQSRNYDSLDPSDSTPETSRVIKLVGNREKSTLKVQG